MKFIPSKTSIKAFAKYILLGSAVFAFGLVWNFPYERIRETLTRTLTRNTGYRFDMDRLSPALPIGFRAEGAKISGPPMAGTPVNLEFKTLKVSVSPFSLLLYPIRKSISLSYSAQQEKTFWSGGLGVGKTEAFFRVRTDDFRIDQDFPLSGVDPMLASALLKLKTRLKMGMEFTGPIEALTRGDLSTSTGDLTLTASQVSITPPMLKELRFDKVTINAALDKGKLDIKSIQLFGPDISGSANGSIRVDPFLPRSQLQLDAKLNISEKASELRTLITTFGPQIGLNMTPDGQVALRVTGPLSPSNQLSVRGF